MAKENLLSRKFTQNRKAWIAWNDKNPWPAAPSAFDIFQEAFNLGWNAAVQTTEDDDHDED